MKIRLRKFKPDGSFKNITTLDATLDKFAVLFKSACVGHKNWENSISAVLEPGDILTFVETHQEFCRITMGLDYNMKDLLKHKIARELCYLEIDLLHRQIFYACPIQRTYLYETLEMMAILLEFELYKIRYYREADLVELRDPCIPGVGHTVLQYAPPECN